MNSQSIGDLAAKSLALVVGLMLLLPSGYKLYSYCIFRYQSVAVTGTVENPMRGRDLGSRPLIVYKDLQGNVHEFKTRAKTHWFFAPQKGEPITVFVDERDPQIAMVDSRFHYLFLPLFFFLTGGIAVCRFIRDGWTALVHRSGRSPGPQASLLVKGERSSDT